MTVAVTHREAVESGSEFYCTGKPCRYGHLSMRLTKNHQCVDCIVAARKVAPKPKNDSEYNALNARRMRAWRENNREHSRTYMAEYMKKYRKRNSDLKIPNEPTVFVRPEEPDFE